tara:strand:- start:672 stop:821 length:150 start_codon:yes stop_codon:yes gene_type:complete
MTRRMRLERARNIAEGIIARNNSKEEWVSLKQVVNDINFVLKELEPRRK